MKKILLVFMILSLNILICAAADAKYPNLNPDLWKNHMSNDILPFWTSSDALGGETPGNFPTDRRYDGSVDTFKTDRYPRMMSRQIFAYCAGYLVTGDVSLLRYARLGINYLTAKAYDKESGLWCGRLTANGVPVPGVDRMAQDTAYDLVGLALYYFITGDREVESIILKTSSTIFDEKIYYDKTNNRIRNGISYDGSKVVSPNNYDLTAMLDQLNAYLITLQPVMRDEKNRKLFLDYIDKLAAMMFEHFYVDGIFSRKNVTGRDKFSDKQLFNWYLQYSDLGHTMKSYWMIEMANRNLDNPRYKSILKSNIKRLLGISYDRANGCWSERLISHDRASSGGISWWTYCEQDQLAAYMAVADGDDEYLKIVDKTSGFFLRSFVDKVNGECYFGVSSSGTTGDQLANKAGMWKNGFHSSEHALIMYIVSSWLAGGGVELYFAPVNGEELIYKPYVFNGTVESVTPDGEFEIGGKKMVKTKVAFKIIK